MYENNYVGAKAQETKLERENQWMKTFRTTYPYGMNKRTRNNNNVNDGPTERTFSPILRSIELSNRSHGNTKNF